MAHNSALLEEISDMLIESPLFNQFQSEEIQAAARHFGIINVEKGEAIFREGDDGTFMCIVHQGRVNVIKENQNGDHVVMATGGVGQAFGEMAVLDGERRSATCAAASDCVMLILSKDAMDNMLQEQPRIGAKILRAIAISMSRRMRWADGKLVDRAE